VAGRDAAERYEELRCRALAGEPDGFALGQAVLQRRGVLAWIRASAELAPARATPAVGVLPAACGELVGVLAGMALVALGA
jgi:hypothetical protein